MLLCNLVWWSRQRGICFLFIAAICLVKKSSLLLGFFRSLIFLTWCISTPSSLPHITQFAFRLDLVNLAFHTFSRFFKGSCGAVLTFDMFIEGWYFMSINDILFFSFTSNPRSFPNFLNMAARVLNLNFRASVNPQDSLISHPIQAISVLLSAKL